MSLASNTANTAAGHSQHLPRLQPGAEEPDHGLRGHRGAPQRQPHRRPRHHHLHHRAVRLGQVHAAARGQPAARTQERRRAAGRRERPEGQAGHPARPYRHGVPALQPLSGPHSAGKRGAGTLERQGNVQGRGQGARRAGGSPRSAWPNARTTGPATSPAASSSASPSRGRWPWSPKSCSSTRQPVPWTPNWSRAC